MQITAVLTRRTIAVLGVTAAAMAGGAPAQASDASLRKAVIQQEKKVDAVADDFAEASEDAVSAVGRDQALKAVTKLKTAVRRQRAAVVKEKATSSRLKRARTQYLAAVTRYATGLKTFGQGLEAFDPDAPAEAAGLIKEAKSQLKAAATSRERARKLIVRRS
jgi:spermidine/putrescine-binding protein